MTGKQYASAGRALAEMFIFLCIMIAYCSSARDVSAAEVYTEQNTAVTVSEKDMLRMSAANYSAEWTGVEGKIKTSRDGCSILCIPVVSKDDEWSLEDFLDIRFTDAGAIDGRQIDVAVHISRITVSGRTGSADGETDDGYMGVCLLGDDDKGFRFGATIDDGCGYRAVKKTEYTVTVRYHDTGETADMPFFQTVRDIQYMDSSVRQGWESVDGYEGIYYRYIDNQLVFAGNKIYVRKGTDQVTGADTLLKAGIYAPTAGGVFSGVFYEGDSSTRFELYSQYAMLDSPVKTRNEVDVIEPGAEIKYSITQDFGTFYKDTMTLYPEFTMTDRLPDSLEYLSASVRGSVSGRMESNGKLSYDESSGTVSFSMKQSWLGSKMHYNGEKITLEIVCRVKNDSSVSEIKNTGKVRYRAGAEYASNTVADKVVRVYRARYEYVSGTEWKEMPEHIICGYAPYDVKDDTLYYPGDVVKRKDNVENGSTYIVWESGHKKGEWILQWDADEKTVVDSDVIFTGTWTYRYLPDIVIQKEISLKEAQACINHGYPGFLFSVTGRESGKTWYRSAWIDERILEMLEEDGGSFYDGWTNCYYVREGGSIFVECREVRGADDDYIVKELQTSRNSPSCVSAEYCRSDRNVRIDGASGSEVVVPFRTGTFSKGDPGYGAEYARVCFRNTKVRWDRLSHTDFILNVLNPVQ